MFTNSRVATTTLRTGRFEATLLAAQRRVDRDPLADLQTADFLAEYGYLAKQFMTGNDRQFEVRLRRRHRFPLQKAEDTATDSGNFALDHCAVVVGQIRHRDVWKLELRKARKVLRGRLVLTALNGEKQCFHKHPFQ